MARVKLNPFACPSCGNGNLVEIEIDEDIVRNAPRLPTVVTATCTKNHTLVLFVDGQFKIRDIEVATKSVKAEKDAIDNTEDWISSL